MSPPLATTLHARPSPDYESHLQEALDTLQAAVAEFGAQAITQASSLGAEDVVLTHLIETHGLHIPLFVLDTGALHPETLQLLEATRQRQPASVTVYQPDAHQVATFVQANGNDAIYRSIAWRKACCQIRKLEPLQRALQGKAAWITGLRREQSGARADVLVRDASEAGRPVKFSPLANWTWGDIWHYVATHRVPYNPLHDQFYPSIGCAPCTRAITLGEDFRSGRWWWEQDNARECGLHVSNSATTPLAAPGTGDPSAIPLEKQQP